MLSALSLGNTAAPPIGPLARSTLSRSMTFYDRHGTILARASIEAPESAVSGVASVHVRKLGQNYVTRGNIGALLAEFSKAKTPGDYLWGARAITFVKVDATPSGWTERQVTTTDAADLRETLSAIPDQAVNGDPPERPRESCGGHQLVIVNAARGVGGTLSLPCDSNARTARMLVGDSELEIRVDTAAIRKIMARQVGWKRRSP